MPSKPKNSAKKKAPPVAAATACSASSKYRTSRRIKFVCDDWGGKEETHMEIEWNGQTLFIDITDERIHIIGPCFDVFKDAVNAMDMKPTYPRQNAPHQATASDGRPQA